MSLGVSLRLLVQGKWGADTGVHTHTMQGISTCVNNVTKLKRDCSEVRDNLAQLLDNLRVALGEPVCHLVARTCQIVFGCLPTGLEVASENPDTRRAFRTVSGA